MLPTIKDIYELWKNQRYTFWFITVLAVVALYWLGRLGGWWSNPNAAQWVQAFGSIIAIVGSAAIAYWISSLEANRVQRSVTATIVNFLYRANQASIALIGLVDLDADSPEDIPDEVFLSKERWPAFAGTLQELLSGFDDFDRKIKRIEGSIYLAGPDVVATFSFVEMKIEVIRMISELLFGGDSPKASALYGCSIEKPFWQEVFAFRTGVRHIARVAKY